MAADRAHPEHQPGPDDWLDGLAGRAGQSADHADGMRLRDALMPDVALSTGALSWADVQAAAASQLDEAAAQSTRTSVQGEDTAAHRVDQPAANQAWFKPRLAWAASLLVGCGVLMALMLPRDHDEGLRGLGGAEPVAQWVVAEPVARAQALSDELVALGARVDLRRDGQGAVLQIEVPADHRERVNQRLAALETSVDAQGHLLVAVRRPSASNAAIGR